MVEYASSTKEIQKWLKRFARGNTKQTGRQLAKLSHSNPCLLFDVIVAQIKSYENQIQFVISSLNNCTMIALDVIAYEILRHISGDRDKCEPDGGIASWMNYLASFSGQFFRKYYWIDSRGIFHYICGKLKVGIIDDVIILSEIMSRMTGYTPLEIDKMNEKQLESMAGGKQLRVVSLNFSSDVKRAKTSSHALAQLFWKKTKKESPKLLSPPDTSMESEPFSLAMSLGTVIAQNLDILFYKQNAKALKFEGNIYDRLKEFFLQFLQFISNETESPEHYEQLIPHDPIARFVSQHKLSPEAVFSIITPK